MRFALSPAAAILLFGAACQPPPPAGLTDQDRAAINQKTEEFTKGLNARDWAGVVNGYYTEDAVMMPSNGPSVSGRAGIQAWMASYPPFSDFASRTVEIEGSGSTAYVVGRYALKVMPPGGAPVADSGKYLEIWKKGEDGSWRVARDIFNSDVPMPMPAPADSTVKKPAPKRK
ncbi:MAG TPA: DUF4440 domain-containing protein [Gemmatimonadales bacterium]|jgi:ketosteroid isomerase-like protein|nr:DUF4440 domain-containing protein [Gemmatimonadales bacterium]